MQERTSIIVMQIIALIFSVIIHEICHGLAAWWRGDTTAKDKGRLTLNPIPHIDPIMSIAVPLLLIVTGSSFIFGGAKPVPVNIYNLKNPKKDMAIIAAAGPLSNLSLAFIASVIYRAMCFFSIYQYHVFIFLQIFVIINILLAVINLIPIPPLDGSKIISPFLGDRVGNIFIKLGMFPGIFLIFFLFMMFRSVFSKIIMTVASIFLGI